MTRLEEARERARHHQRHVELLELLDEHDVDVRDSTISTGDDVDGTPVSLEVVVPTESLATSSTDLPTIEDDTGEDSEDDVDEEPAPDEVEEQPDEPDSDTEDVVDDEADAVDEETSSTTDDEQDVDDDTGSVDARSDHPTGPDVTAEDARTDLLATAVDDVGESVDYLTKDQVRSIAVANVDDAPNSATKAEYWAVLADAFDVELETDLSGGPRKASLVELRDAVVDDDGAGHEPELVVDDEQDEDVQDDVDEPEVELEEGEDAESMAPHRNMYDLTRETCLALGVQPPETDPGSSYTVTARVLRDVAAAVTGQEVSSLQLKDKSELCETIGDWLSVQDWRAHREDLLQLHDLVVPDARKDGEMEFDEVLLEAEVPFELDEASFHVAVADSESIRDLARALGWDDLQSVRRTLYLAGAYDELERPEAKTNTKYSTEAEA